MFDTTDAIYLERAKFARDTEYMKAIASDAMEDQRVMDFIMEDADDAIFGPDPDMDNLIDNIPEDDDEDDESEELNTILNAKDALTFDQMLGINSDEDDDNIDIDSELFNGEDELDLDFDE